MLAELPRGDYYDALVKSHVNQIEQAAELIARYTAREPRDPNGFRLLARVDLLLRKQAAAAEALKRVAALGGPAPISRPAPRRSRARPTRQRGGADALAVEQVDRATARDAAGSWNRCWKQAAAGRYRGDAGVVGAGGGGPGRAGGARQVKADPAADPMVVANLSALVRMANLDFAGAQAIWREAAQGAGRTARRSRSIWPACST